MEPFCLIFLGEILIDNKLFATLERGNEQPDLANDPIVAGDWTDMDDGFMGGRRFHILSP